MKNTRDILFKKNWLHFCSYERECFQNTMLMFTMLRFIWRHVASALSFQDLNKINDLHLEFKISDDINDILSHARGAGSPSNRQTSEPRSVNPLVREQVD